ncbi:MAG: hypothetical protein OEV74_06110 [Cyclobacteriaceae bacterium]|nr:hypothetical protein [Cyclobacteriaceae bacterium]MDH4295833.1 hypothetical protein [Cyclobacteriaceae bacterium]MDH5247678.1 hypothetical protein [Cyclobacteriaceae bacterium]
MRFFTFTNNFNWKYIIGEILLIFVGISLAIWFNNWNASDKNKHAKEIAIVKIKEEIKNNRDELIIAQKSNQLILNAFSEFSDLFDGTTSEITTSPAILNVMQEKYPGFYRIVDSVEVKAGIFHYRGGTYIQLEIPTLTDIAWETTKSISITNEFSYECLYELASMYELQGRVQKETDKASDALQKREIKQLMSILQFLEQLNEQLDKSYESMFDGIDDCN